MDDGQREARVQTLQAELQAERRRRVAAEAEAVAARAASDELKLHVQRAGLERPIRAQRLRRNGLLILLALLAMGLAATATTGIVHSRRVEGALGDGLALANRRIEELSRQRLADQREAAALKAQLRDASRRQDQARANLLECQARCPADPPDPGAVPRLLRQAEEAVDSADCHRAMELSRKVILQSPTERRAIQILGVCACTIRNRASAHWAHDKLTGLPRASLRKLCAKTGIALE